MTQSPTISRALRVAVLSRHPLTRAGLTQLLSGNSERVSVVERSTLVGDLAKPDVVLYDLADHLETITHDLAALLAEGVPVVALTSYGRSSLAETALDMGAAETVHVDISAAGLLAALERAASGETTTLLAHRRERHDAARARAHLTDREMSVLELVGTGLVNQDIAERLFVSVNTVKTYIRSAYRKIGVSRRAEAVLWAVHHDLTPSFAGEVSSHPGSANPAR